MFKKFVICTLGLASGVAVASFTHEIFNGAFPSEESSSIAHLDESETTPLSDVNNASTAEQELDLYGHSFVSEKSNRSEEKAKSESGTISPKATEVEKTTTKTAPIASTDEKPITKPKAVANQKPAHLREPSTPIAVEKTFTADKPSPQKDDAAKKTTPKKIAKTKTDKPSIKPTPSAKTPVAKKANPTPKTKTTTKQNQRSSNAIAKANDMDADPVLERFSREVFKGDNGKKLNYRLLQPKYFDSKKTYPLVVLLHGAGERGSDNESQLAHGTKVLASEENSRKHPCFVLVPQCPKDEKWVDADWTQLSHITADQPTESMAMVMGAIDQIVLQQPVDPNRIYATGLSMGGFGVFDLVSRRPNMFAAGAPLCGGGDVSPEIASRLARIPLWIVHGDQDKAVNVERSRQMVKAIVEAGGKPKYDEIAGAGHDIWTQTYSNPKFYDWIFEQRLDAAKEPVAVTAPSKAKAESPATPKKNLAETKTIDPPKTIDPLKAAKPAATETAAKPVSQTPEKKLKETSARVVNEAARTQPTTPLANSPLENSVEKARDMEPGSLAHHFPKGKESPKPTKTNPSKPADEQQAQDVEVAKQESQPTETQPSENVAETPSVDLNKLKVEDLQGKWSAVVARYNGKPLPEPRLKTMGFEFDNGLLTISQNGKRQNGMIELGLVVQTDVVDARMIDFIAPKKNSPLIKGLCYFESDKLVILLHAPGEPRPVSFEKVDEGRLLVLKRNNE